MRPCPTALLRAVLAALVLALAGGLQRFVVLCSPVDGAAHVTVTACSHCAHAQTGDAARADHDGDDAPHHTADDGHGGCVHSPLAPQPGPLPGNAMPVPPPVAATAIAAATPDRCLATSRARTPVQATGPPRPDGRVARRATDVQRE